MNLYKIILLMALLHVEFASTKEMTVEEKIRKTIEMRGPPKGISPENGFVPTVEVAIEVVHAILKPIFKDELENQLPLRGRKNGKNWIVEGREREKCSENSKNCFQLDQTPVFVEISAADGKVIRVVKYK